MNRSDLTLKFEAISEISKKTTAKHFKPSVKSVISNDNLSKSIRSKKDAQIFINELKSTIKNNS